MRNRIIALLCLAYSAVWLLLAWPPIRDPDDATGSHGGAWFLFAFYLAAAAASWRGVRWAQWLAAAAAALVCLLFVAISVGTHGATVVCYLSSPCTLEVLPPFIFVFAVFALLLLPSRPAT